MTFPSFPKRSSSDDEALDQALNAWASGDNRRHSERRGESQREVTSSHSEHSEESPREALTSHALEFHRWADETRRSDPAAKGPAAGTWNRVLRSTAQTNPKGKTMNTAAISSHRQPASLAPTETLGESIRRYSNLAATLAIVIAVTVGGWFAMSQLPPGGDGQFAAIQGTPEVAESATCDVEPLTVDEVVAIVENPLVAVEDSWWATPAPGSDTQADMLAHNQELLELYSVTGILNTAPANTNLGLIVPEEEVFSDATDAANRILDCLTGDATMGQIWSLMDPISVQSQVLRNFPVYRDTETVRSFIEERIDEQSGMEYDYLQMQPDLEITANPRRGDARLIADPMLQPLDYDTVLYVGWQGKDADGNVIFADDWEGTTVEGESTHSNKTSMILVHSESTGTWYFVGFYGLRG